MGVVMSAIGRSFKHVFSRALEIRIIMLGLDAAGKTTILYKIKLGDVVTTIPTIGFNVETVEYKNVSITVWDVGGKDKLRALWRHYYPGTKTLIFVVDSNDRYRMGVDANFGEARDELIRLLSQEELKGLPLLVFANKQDLPNAMSAQEVWDTLQLCNIRDRPVRLQGCCALTGAGLYDGLDWLSKTMEDMRNGKNVLVFEDAAMAGKLISEITSLPQVLVVIISAYLSYGNVRECPD